MIARTATQSHQARACSARFFSSIHVPIHHDPNTSPCPSSPQSSNTSSSAQQKSFVRTYSHIPRHKALVRDVPLLPMDGVVEFPRGPIRLRVSDASLNVMISETASSPSSSRIIGLISQLSHFPEGDRDVVRKHIRSASRSTNPAPFSSDQFFQRISTMKSDDHDTEEFVPSEVGLTGWRCADVGTLIRIDRVTETTATPDFDHNNPTTKLIMGGSAHGVSSATMNEIPTHAYKTTQKICTVSATTLNRFAVRSYKRTLFGYWTADVEVLREDWGFGGPRYANILMNDIQSALTPHILDMCEPRYKAEVLASTNPVHFSYVVPKIFPSFGISSLLSQAVLQCSTCTTRLILEQHVIRQIVKMFGLPTTTTTHNTPLSASTSPSHFGPHLSK